MRSWTYIGLWPVNYRTPVGLRVGWNSNSIFPLCFSLKKSDKLPNQGRRIWR